MNEKRSKVIEYLSENCSADTVISLLMQFVNEENWEQLYDQLEKDGIPYFCEEEEDDDTPEEVREALEYVRENMNDYDLAMMSAGISKAYAEHVPPSTFVDDGKFIDWLEEYGADNDLPEGWWENYGDIDDWLMWL